VAKRWTVRPEGSNWGEFGEDDQLGRLNLLTPQKVLQGVAEVREGRSFCLSLPLDHPHKQLNPARHPPQRYATVRQGGIPSHNYPLRHLDPAYSDIVNDDAVLLCTQFSTQWDSLAHVGALFDVDGTGTPVPVFYNGWSGDSDILAPYDDPEAGPMTRYPGMEAKALGIAHMATTGVQGRGVLVDLHSHFGSAHTRVDYDALMRVCEADDVLVEPGDMLCFYTGFADAVLAIDDDTDPAALHQSYAALDGRDERLLQWITDTGVAVLIADNYAVEAFPAPPEGDCCAALPLHEHCLFKLGVHLGELWYLTELAAWLREAGRNRFLLTAPPLRLPGAVGSPVTPVATV
jgi:hypothetical protein